jgi:hypothetical protein
MWGMESKPTPTKRATKKTAPKPKPDLTLVKPEPKIIDGKHYVPVYLHRFLFENGDVVDIETPRDDSTLRDVLLTQRHIHGDRIAGSTRLNFVGYADMEHYVEV